MAAVAAAFAGTAGIAAYLNGKYHIAQDLNVQRTRKQAAKYLAGLASTNRLSPWYAFARHVPAHPTALCIWSRTHSYTWQQTHDRAAQWGSFLLARGVQPGDLVGMYLNNTADFLVIWLGLWSIGCAPALLNPNLKKEALRHCLRVAGVRVVLVDGDAEVVGRFKEAVEWEEEKGLQELDACVVDETLLRGIYDAGKVEVPTDYYRAQVCGDTPTCLLYTSGTTGLPKAAPYNTARYHARGSPPYNSVPGPSGDRWYCCMPLFHGTGGMALLSALTGGCSVAVGRKFSVSSFWNDIHDSGASIFVYVGEAARYLLNAAPHPLERDHPRLKAMYGNGMRPDVWGRFQERFDVPQVIEFFNSTEGVLGMANHTYNGWRQHAVGHHGLLQRRENYNTLVPVSIDAETGALARDPKTGFVKRNSYEEGGEILVRIDSEKAFAGYYHDAAATAKKFERDVFAKGDLFYRSGDALRRDGEGRWFFLDRLGDTFRWKSENVSTAEVAEVLGHHPDILEAMVYGVLVPGHDGRAGCVALRFKPEVEGKIQANPETFDWAAFLQHARGQLPKHAVPVFVRLVGGRSSTTDNNKQNKAPLRDEGVELQRYGEKVVGGEADQVWWVPPGAETYVRFTVNDLEALRRGKVVL